MFHDNDITFHHIARIAKNTAFGAPVSGLGPSLIGLGPGTVYYLYDFFRIRNLRLRQTGQYYIEMLLQVQI